MAALSAKGLATEYLAALEEMSKSRLIRTKQEALMYMTAWLGSKLAEASAQFNQDTFREDAVQLVYFKS